MLFSSNIFIFLFLPLYLAIYFIADSLCIADNKIFGISKRGHYIRNGVLLLLSIFFYYWGVGKFIFVFLTSIVVNYIVGRFICTTTKPKAFLALGITFNLSFLLYYKYFSFLHEQMVIPLFKALAQIQLEKHAAIMLPVGISFYTFMAISYLVDTYRKRSDFSGLFDFGLFLSLFPHLVAGPIVRYSEIAGELKNRKTTTSMLFEGIWRFSIGLGKKIILANSLGSVSDKIFLLPNTELTTTLSWLGIVCYTFQIYFDFSGYSDMAIGLARVFGFHFPENFNAPYRSQTITEFWKRWHMTLSRWFKDYLYIPLGGNRKGEVRTYLNLTIVFLLCGLWHGASWTFVAWGAYHGLLLIIERVLDNKFSFKTTGIFGNIVTLFLVMIGWVLFRSTTLVSAGHYLMTMFHISTESSMQYFTFSYLVDPRTATYLLFASFIVFSPFEKSQKLVTSMGDARMDIVKGFAALSITLYSVVLLSKTEFNPFIYFQF